MKLNDFMGGNFLRKEDVGVEGVDLTFHNFTNETVGQELETKPVAHFREHGYKPLVLNKSVMGFLVALFGTDDTDKMIGRRVNVFNDLSVSFNGVRGGTRVRACYNPQAQQQARKVVAQADMFDDQLPANM